MFSCKQVVNEKLSVENDPPVLPTIAITDTMNLSRV
jgi:hypothetical protein